MAETGEKPHFSSRTLDLGEKAQKVFGRTSVGRWATRSNVPAYLRLEWFKLDVDPESFHWARTIDGDPDVRKRSLPRKWSNAAILGVDGSELAGLGAHDPEANSWAKDAVAFESEGIVRVGINPDSSQIFGGAGKKGQEGMLTVAMRLGRGPLNATMGHYQPETGQLLTPNHIVVLEERIPNDEICPPEYPHTRLVG